MHGPEVWEELCRRIAEGRSLRDVCRDEDMPSKDYAIEYAQKDETFALQYARAREQRAEFLAEEILSIADQSEDPHKARLQVDARKWFASKLDPRRFGERLDIDHSVRVAEVSADALTDAGWAAQYATNRVATSGGTTESSD